MVKTKAALMIALLMLLSSAFGCAAQAQDLAGADANSPAAAEYTIPKYRPWFSKQTGDLFISAEEALEDFDHMWGTLDQNASFLELIDRHEALIGTNSVKVRENAKRVRTELENKEVIWLYDFYRILNESVEPLSNVGHLGVLNTVLYDYFYDTAKEIKKNTDDANKNSLLPSYYGVLNNRKSREAYKYLRGLEKGHLSTPYNQEQLDQFVEYFNHFNYVGEHRIPYIQIGSFMYPDISCDEAAIDMIYSFIKDNKHADHIIIDIRGNGGGNSFIWLAGIVEPLLNETVILKDVSVSKAGPFSRYVRKYDGSSPPDEVLTKEISFVNPEDLNKFDAVFMEEQIYRPTTKNVGFNGRVWLLVDKDVRSAAEGFTIFCKSAGFATVVGERTGGGGKGSQPIAFPLPNSGLLVLFEDIAGFNVDGTCNAFVGTSPDIEITDPNDALAVCLSAIEQHDG